jgi:hypothetical protein
MSTGIREEDCSYKVALARPGARTEQHFQQEQELGYIFEWMPTEGERAMSWIAGDCEGNDL